MASIRDVIPIINQKGYLTLHNSDSPRVVLVNVPLTGENYLTWSISILIALRAKDKVHFVTEKHKKPEKDSKYFEQWQKVDNIVFLGFLTLFPEKSWRHFYIPRLLMNCGKSWLNALEVAMDLKIYQIVREINSFQKGNMNVMVYFTKLKKVWDELSCFILFPLCTCGATKEMSEICESDILTQFLMGLNSSYDQVKNHILLIDPFPPVSRAYAMVLRVEK